MGVLLSPSDFVRGELSRVTREARKGVIIQVYRGGELVPTDAELDAVGRRTLDMAEGFGGYWPGEIDTFIVSSLPDKDVAP